MIKSKFESLCNLQSDINEHLPTLKKYATGCDTVVEIGVRWIVSTWAFLSAQPKKLISVDIKHPSHFGANLSEVELAAKENGTEFSFVLSDSREAEIPNCDLLFIDTWHVYDLLKIELEKHGNKASKYIILHDTETFAWTGEDAGFKGLIPAIEEFLDANKHWKIKEIFKNNNGLTILERK